MGKTSAKPSAKKTPASKVSKALRQPHRLLQHARGTMLFLVTRILRPWLLPSTRYQFGDNVRLQRVSSLLAAGEDSVVSIGANTIIYENARVEAHGAGKLKVGTGSILGDVRIYCRGKVELGEGCLTSWNVLIQDFDAHPVGAADRRQQVQEMIEGFHPRFSGKKSPLARTEFSFPAEEVIIGKNVWLGAGVTILKGSRIGDDSIVAAGAVVAGGTFPAGSLVAGNPAKLVKELPR